MQKQEASPVRAAIDVGSNTIHIVVARCKADDLDIIEDEVEMVRIGESVTKTGAISAEKRDAAIALLQKYKQLAEQHQAERILVIATEAIRKASNSDKFLEAVHQQTGLEVQIISGDVEAVLTFYGATYEQNKEPGASTQLAVMDLGGGSTELVTAKNMHILWHTSIPIGSGWLHDRYLRSNPPTPDDLNVAQSFLRTYFQGMGFKAQLNSLIVTGGSANSLLLLAQKAFRLAAHDKQMTYDILVRCEGLMSALPAEEIAQRYEQPLDRARILPAGALIIREMMSHLHLNEITVSPHGIREGALLAYQRYGEQWLERVQAEAQNTAQDNGSGAKRKKEQEETFAQFGERQLHEKVKKLLDWRDEVLKHDDVEAVHKMRVATRRLRATLDAFQSCCKPGQFKKVYSTIKNMADILGMARDTDVMLEGLHATYEQVPGEEQAGVKWLISRLETYRQQRQQELEDFFDKLDEDALKQQIETCIQKGALQHGKG